MNGLIEATKNGTTADLRFAVMSESSQLDAVDDAGKTAFIHAVQQGDQAKVKILLDYGADISLCDLTGKSAADYAEGGVKIVLKNHQENLANLRKIQQTQRDNLQQAQKGQNKRDKIVLVVAPLVVIILAVLLYAVYWPLHNGIANGYVEYCSGASCNRYAFPTNLVIYSLFILLAGVALLILGLLLVLTLVAVVKVIKRKINGTPTPLIASMERSLAALDHRLAPYERS